MRGIHKWNTCLCMYPRFSDTSFSICCATRGGGGRHTGMEQVFTFARVGWWNIAQVRMLHRHFIFLGNINLFLKLTGTFRSIKGSSQGRSYSFISMYRMNPSVASFSSSAPFSSAATCYWINCHGNHTISDRWFLGSRCFLSEGTDFTFPQRLARWGNGGRQGGDAFSQGTE